MNGLGDRRGLSAVIYAAMCIAGWAAANLLFALGASVVLFWMFANGSADGFFAEAGNLARHFDAADLSARAAFLAKVRLAFAVVFGAVCLIRLQRVTRILGFWKAGLFASAKSVKG